MKKETTVLELLKENEENWIKGKSIVDRCQLKSKVELRLIINHLRNNEKEPIISNTAYGYKYTKSYNDLLECGLKIKSRAKEENKTGNTLIELAYKLV